MDGKQKMRLMLLLIAGALLIGGVNYWTNMENERLLYAENSIQVTKHRERPSRGKLNTNFSTLQMRSSKDITSIKGFAQPVSTDSIPIGTVPTPENCIARSDLNRKKKEQLEVWRESQKYALFNFLFRNQNSLKVVSKPLSPADGPSVQQPIHATTRLEARAMANAATPGAVDPFEPISENRFHEFPQVNRRQGTIDNDALMNLFPDNKNKRVRKLKIPPPPFPTLPGIDERVPPPPPVEPSAGKFSSDSPVNHNSSLGDLPDPPSPPTIIDFLTVIGVMDQLVFFRVDQSLQMQQGLPPTISLNPGEHFMTLELISISNGCVTVSDSGTLYKVPYPGVMKESGI